MHPILNLLGTLLAPEVVKGVSVLAEDAYDWFTDKPCKTQMDEEYYNLIKEDKNNERI